MGEIFEEGSEGNFVADGAWIPEEHKAEESLKNITNFGDLVKGYVNAQHTIGKKGVIIPEEGASDEEMNAFHTAMGRPEKATDYEFAKPNLPDGMEFDEKLDAGFREFAHKNGLSQKKAAAISDWYNGNMIEAYGANTKAIKANQEESVALLKKHGVKMQMLILLWRKKRSRLSFLTKLNRLCLVNSAIVLRLLRHS